MPTIHSAGTVVSFLACCALANPAAAATITAASCADRDVQAAVNAAANGDVVRIPMGTCTWTAKVTIPNTKGITLEGAGEGVTNINDGTAASSSLLAVAIASGRSLTRVTGITFSHNGVTKTGNAGLLQVFGEGTDAFRIDHVTVNDLRGRSIVVGYSDAGSSPGNALYGVIDHCTINAPNNLTSQGLTLQGAGAENDVPFSRPFEPGTNKAIYVENCTFNFDFQNDGVLDAYGGARYVFRFNTIHGASIGHHGADSGGYRGVHTVEIYRNTWRSSHPVSWMQNWRSGSGVSFDNEYTGGFNRLMNASVYRARPQTFVLKYGQCDGSSSWDGNAGGSSNRGWPCLDQVGYTFTSARAGGYVSRPLYLWNNTEDGAEVGMAASETASYLGANRDYFNKVDSFNGATGVGVGALANRPATCTAGVAYWATDQGAWNATGENGVLYTCTATNVWSLYYSPYTYPHPLIKATPPNNLRLVP